MKILVLTSRYTATRDIIDEDFGRQTRLFEALADFGHVITFFCADYRKHESKDVWMHGLNVKIRPFGFSHFISFAWELRRELKNGKYDLLIATSDPLWGVMGLRCARKARVKFLYDLHDNYEVYGMYKIPFFRLFDRRAVRNADIVTTVSNALKAKLADEGLREKNVFVVQNGAETKIFRPMDKTKCRKELGLPSDRRIIVYAGSLQRSQGIDVLLAAFEIVRKINKDAMLALAGRFFAREKKYLNLSAKGIRYLGSLSQDNVARLINCADVAVVPNRDNDFTRYCFPYKAAEYAACQVPIVATAVGDAAMLVRQGDNICAPDDAHDMAEKINVQLGLGGKRMEYDISKNTWKHIAGQLDKIIRKC